MIVEVSFAEAAARCARFRTSSATTAKPRPCSPARAASTAAFRARRFVWKAISLITSMILAMRPALSWMSFMAPWSSPMLVFPCSAARRAFWARVAAEDALSAF